jgi:hypothetical protein
MSGICDQFKLLQSNYTPVNVIHYFEYLKGCDLEDIVCNAKYIMVEPTKGPGRLMATASSPDITTTQLAKLFNTVDAYIRKCELGNYSNFDHLTDLKELRYLIKCKYDEKSSDSYLRMDTVEYFKNQYEMTTLYEFPELVTEGIGTAYARMNYKLSGPSALKGGERGSDRAVRRIMKTEKVSEKDAIKKLISQYEAQIKELEPKHKRYVDKTVSKEEKNKDYNTYLYGTEAHLEFNLKILRHIIEYQKGRLSHASTQVVKENIGDMAPDIIYAEETLEELPVLKKKALNKFAYHFTEFAMDDSDDISVESFNNMVSASIEFDRLVEKEEILTEAVMDKARGAAIRGDELARKAANRLRRSGNDVKRVKNVAKRIPGHFDNLINSTFGEIKKMDENERRKRIIEGGFKVKLFKIIRNGVLLGAAWAVGPAVAAIAIIVHLLMDKRLDNRARQDLTDDLKDELRIVQEKIKDAEGKGDNRKKYQLMRIENALKRDVDKVQYRLKAARATTSDKGVTK